MGRFGERGNIDIELLMIKAYAYCSGRRFEEALKVYEQVIQLEEQNVDAWMGKGIAFCQLGRLAESLDSYDRGIELAPQYDKLWYNKGITYEALEDYDAALYCYDRALSINNNYYKAFLRRQELVKQLQRKGMILNDESVGNITVAEGRQGKRFITPEEVDADEMRRITETVKEVLERLRLDKSFAQQVIADPIKALEEFKLPAPEIDNIVQMAKLSLMF